MKRVGSRRETRSEQIRSAADVDKEGQEINSTWDQK